MDAFLENFCAQMLEGNPLCAQASQKAAREAEPMHRRLLELAGEEGETIWEAAVLTGCAEVTPSFWAGLHFGLRLLAACLAD